MFPQQFQNKITTADEPHVKNEDKQKTAIVPSTEEGGGGESPSDGSSMLDPLYYHYICSTLFETL